MFLVEKLFDNLGEIANSRAWPELVALVVNEGDLMEPTSQLISASILRSSSLSEWYEDFPTIL
jgi:hypothetical protein